jgi:pteridine reductase
VRKVALITGGARRVGRAIALHLAERGYDLLVTYLRSEADARSLVAECRELGSRCEILRCNLTHPSSAVDSIVQSHTSHFPGRLDLLIHNASVFPEASLERTTPELLHQVLAVHVTAPLLLTGRFAPLLRESRGSVVSITDGVERRGYVRYPAYAASKAALSSLVYSFAKSLAPHARSNGIAPGVVDWPEDMPADERERHLARIPLARPGTPQDIARAVWFLAEESPYTTGTILHIDGGRNAT